MDQKITKAELFKLYKERIQTCKVGKEIEKIELDFDCQIIKEKL